MKIVTLTSIMNVILTLLAVTVLSANPAWSAKLYKWIDDEGNISYQDSPPPVGSKLIREEDIDLSPSTTEPDQTQPSLAVTVYTVDDCESCEILLLRLQNWGVNAQEQSLQNREVQARILQLSDGLSAPTLFIGDQIITDLSGPNLSSKLQEAGYQIESSENNQTEEPDQ